MNGVDRETAVTIMQQTYGHRGLASMALDQADVIERMREAGDALAGAVTDIAEPESVLRTWARRWREARLASDEDKR